MWNGVVGGRGGWMVAWAGLGGGVGVGGCIGRALQGELRLLCLFVHMVAWHGRSWGTVERGVWSGVCGVLWFHFPTDPAVSITISEFFTFHITLFSSRCPSFNVVLVDHVVDVDCRVGCRRTPRALRTTFFVLKAYVTCVVFLFNSCSSEPW